MIRLFTVVFFIGFVGTGFATELDSKKNGSGNLTTESVAASSALFAVATAMLANTQGSAMPVDEQKALTCMQGDQLVNSVCVHNSTSTTVTSSGTGTATMTIPVTTTYAPTSH